MNLENNREQDENLERLNYPENEDIYNQEPHLSLEDPEVPEFLRDGAEPMEKNLDIPGAELDDEQEFVGSEDEENNYWSLGGDNHENLETPEDIN